MMNTFCMMNTYTLYISTIFKLTVFLAVNIAAILYSYIHKDRTKCEHYNINLLFLISVVNITFVIFHSIFMNAICLQRTNNTNINSKVSHCCYTWIYSHFIVNFVALIFGCLILSSSSCLIDGIMLIVIPMVLYSIYMITYLIVKKYYTNPTPDLINL